MASLFIVATADKDDGAELKNVVPSPIAVIVTRYAFMAVRPDMFVPLVKLGRVLMSVTPSAIYSFAVYEVALLTGENVTEAVVPVPVAVKVGVSGVLNVELDTVKVIVAVSDLVCR
jgi:hypothetical protein